MTRLKYIIYKMKWHIDHFNKLYKGMSPVCFDEWSDNEYEVKKY